jgi:signal transduction histidine kinase
MNGFEDRRLAERDLQQRQLLEHRGSMSRPLLKQVLTNLIDNALKYSRTRDPARAGRSISPWTRHGMVNATQERLR